MQTSASAATTSATTSELNLAKTGVEQPRCHAAPRRQPSDPRCVSTFLHNEALLVSRTSSITQLTLLPACALIANHCSSTMAKPNITGFDPQKFAAAAKSGTRGDPWAR